ncbi:CNGA3 [Symbiodinium necroappetens]|uniref:CNGA3 protein n=1 Tax=Symbiodinium necroappetens TaxID=1628268 RepID=A0A812SVB7_9DINO|nr:CNGA3 [Symbiodinium necroappetens]
MVMTPMDAFDINVSENQVLRILERTSSITWLMDMILSFARTYGKLNGTEERHLAATSRNYLRTWLVFDFTLVCLDMFIFVIEDTTWVRYMSFFRIIRLFRLLRVLRLAKVKARIAVLAQLLHIMQTQHITDRGLLMLNIVKSLLAVTVINHFTACTWYAVGTILNDENNWVTAHFREPGAVPKPDSLLYLYTTAYHWSITQLTPASMEIYPQSARERIFNIAVILFGLCVFSSFISSMAQQLSALQQLSKSDRHKMQVLRRFISENKMSVALATTIVDFVRQRKSPQAQRPLKVSDIEIFATFPSVLLQKIRTEAHYFVLGKHSLFQSVYHNDRDTFSRVCNTCIVEQSVDRGHDVFKVGDRGAAMYVVNHGKLAYALGMDDLFDPTDSQEWLNLKENNLASIISSGTVVSEVLLRLIFPNLKTPGTLNPKLH